MPPQQGNALLDFVDLGLRFRAHVSFLIGDVGYIGSEGMAVKRFAMNRPCRAISWLAMPQ